MHNPVRSEWINLPGGQPAWLALPPAGQGPGLVLWQEIFGVNAHIRAVAEQYALDGYVVLAPDVFWRQVPRLDAGYAAADLEQGRRLAAALAADELRADIGAAVAALRARAEAGVRKIGALGFCLGGRLAFLSAAWADIDAAVAYYGGGIQGQLAHAGSIRCPVQFHYAEIDEHIPPAAVEQVRAALQGRKGGPPAAIHLYAGARHGFNCWARSAYHPPSAALAHGRTLAFLAEHLW